MYLEVVLGGERMAVTKEMVTVKKARELRQKTKAVEKAWDDEIVKQKEALRALNDEYKDRLKRDDKEQDEDYFKRIEPIIKERDEKAGLIVPEDEESMPMTMAFEGLKAIGEVFGQAHKLKDKAVMEDMVYEDLKKKLADFFLRNDCEFGALFLPKVPS